MWGAVIMTITPVDEIKDILHTFPNRKSLIQRRRLHKEKYHSNFFKKQSSNYRV
jgi:hypothetical protein